MVKEYDMSLWVEFKDNKGYGCDCCSKIYLTENEAFLCERENLK